MLPRFKTSASKMHLTIIGTMTPRTTLIHLKTKQKKIRSFPFASSTRHHFGHFEKDIFLFLHPSLSYPPSVKSEGFNSQGQKNAPNWIFPFQKPVRHEKVFLSFFSSFSFSGSCLTRFPPLFW